MFGIRARQLALHRQRRADRPGRVIGLLERRAEHRQNRIADELVERAVVLEDHFGHAAEEIVQQVADLLRLGVLAHRREADDVAEHHRDVALLRDERAVGLAFLQDAVDHARRVIARQPLAPPRLLEQRQRQPRLLDGHGGVVAERGEHLEIVGR